MHSASSPTLQRYYYYYYYYYYCYYYDCYYYYIYGGRLRERERGRAPSADSNSP